MSRRRIRFRPPGIRPDTKIGPLGPFRGRLGISWFVASLVLAVILVAVGVVFLLRVGIL